MYEPASSCTDIAQSCPTPGRRLPSQPQAADDDAITATGGYELPERGYTGARYDAIRDYIASRYMRGLAKDEIWAGVLAVLAPRVRGAALGARHQVPLRAGVAGHAGAPGRAAGRTGRPRPRS